MQSGWRGASQHSSKVMAARDSRSACTGHSQPTCVPPQGDSKVCDIIISKHQAKLVQDALLKDLLAHSRNNSPVSSNQLGIELRVLGDSWEWLNSQSSANWLKLITFTQHMKQEISSTKHLAKSHTLLHLTTKTEWSQIPNQRFSDHWFSPWVSPWS